MILDGLFLGGCLLPFFGAAAPAAMVVIAAATSVTVLAFLGRHADRMVESLRRSTALGRATLVISTVIVMWGGMEYAAVILTETGLLAAYDPMVTVVPHGSEDWRLAHITADRYRKPDPVLLWRTVSHRPYNAQGFKGPVVEVPKPDGVFRIICYGDSNTDGPGKGDWPSLLQLLLDARPVSRMHRFEVLNAGVAGYSSHQGLLRFQREVGAYRPDVALVSFGWNDAAVTAAGTDRSYRPPPQPIVSLQRLLLRYRFYLVMLQHVPRPEARSGGEPVPRVPIDDFLLNMRQFRSTAVSYGCVPVYLTRTFRPEFVTVGWRSQVPLYNERLLDFGCREGEIVLDVQSQFVARSESLLADQCHFSSDGRVEMARFVLSELSSRGILPGS